MEKKLLRSEKDLIKFFIEEININTIEYVLKIEFPLEDGTYISSPPEFATCSNEAFKEWQMQDCRTDMFKSNDDSVLPKQYPCIVLLDDKDPYDILVEYVYLKDFEG